MGCEQSSTVKDFIEGEYLVFEVSSKIKNEIIGDFSYFMEKKHIPEVLKLDGFLGAELYQVLGKEADKENQYVVCNFKVRSLQQVDYYANVIRPKMAQEKEAEKFKDKVVPEVRLLKFIKSLKK